MQKINANKAYLKTHGTNLKDRWNSVKFRYFYPRRNFTAPGERAIWRSKGSFALLVHYQTQNAKSSEGKVPPPLAEFITAYKHI